jgi:hypothetical protein
MLFIIKKRKKGKVNGNRVKRMRRNMVERNEGVKDKYIYITNK